MTAPPPGHEPVTGRAVLVVPGHTDGPVLRALLAACDRRGLSVVAVAAASRDAFAQVAAGHADVVVARRLRDVPELVLVDGPGRTQPTVLDDLKVKGSLSPETVNGADGDGLRALVQAPPAEPVAAPGPLVTGPVLPPATSGQPRAVRQTRPKPCPGCGEPMVAADLTIHACPLDQPAPA